MRLFELLKSYMSIEDMPRFANRQGVAGLLYEEVQRMYEESGVNPLDRKSLMRLAGYVQKRQTVYHSFKESMERLARFYGKHGIGMMVLKGYGLSLDWPTPDLRPSGDLDIFLFDKGLRAKDESQETKDEGLSGERLEVWKYADRLVEKKLGVKVDDSHEHHTCFSIAGISVENHYDFNNVKLHRDAVEWERMFKSLSSEVRGERLEVREGSNIYLPSADLNALFLMRHMGLHFASTEMSLKQLFDWAFFVEKHGAEVNWAMVMDFLGKMKNVVFFHQINAICVDYLGFEESRFPEIVRDEAVEKRIIDDVFHPEFAEESPKGNVIQQVMFKNRRYWKNGWKRKLIFRDSPVIDFAYGCVAHIVRWRTLGE